jgi:hypothetical protein
VPVLYGSVVLLPHYDPSAARRRWCSGYVVERDDSLGLLLKREFDLADVQAALAKSAWMR